MHKAKADDPHLEELIQRTLAALTPANALDTTPEQLAEQKMLHDLFIKAQSSNLKVKVQLSLT